MGETLQVHCLRCGWSVDCSIEGGPLLPSSCPTCHCADDLGVEANRAWDRLSRLYAWAQGREESEPLVQWFLSRPDQWGTWREFRVKVLDPEALGPPAEKVDLIISFAEASGLWQWWRPENRPNIAEVIETDVVLRHALNCYIRYWRAKR